MSLFRLTAQRQRRLNPASWRNSKPPFFWSLIWLKGLGVFITLILQLSASFAPAQVDCGECPNPLVEMKNLHREDIRNLGDLYKKFVREYYGWEEGEVEMDIERGFNFLEFKKQNPCADMYYILEAGWRKDIRVGAKDGQAKYYIESHLRMSAAQPGEKALAIRVVYDDKGNTLSEQKDYVPKLGTVEVLHRLVCLKNNETYDTGDLSLDWLPDPPPREGYFYAWEGSDGIIIGLFSPGSISGLPIELSRGDVGQTIRNKETPSSFMLDVDDTLYPPYYQLKIRYIHNLYGEALPNRIYVALKPKYGEIIGGKKVNGWSVFPTEQAAINQPVLYKVPECSQTDKEIIEIAAYCDWHTGEPNVGQPRASQQFFIPRCFDLSLTINVSEYYTYQREQSTTVPDSAFIKNTESTEIKEEYAAFIVFNKKPKSVKSLSQERLLYVYEAESWQAATNQFHLRSEEDKLTKVLLLPLFEHSHKTFNKSGKIIRLAPLTTELIFIYDKKKDEIVSVEEMPAFDVYLSFQETSVYDYENNAPDAKPRKKHEVKTDSYEEVRGYIGATIPTDSFSGDRKTVFIGQGKKEERKPPRNVGFGPVQDIVSSSTTQTIRWELRRR